MNLTITGRHFTVSPALHECVTSKLGPVTRHFDQVVDVAIILSFEKLKEKELRNRAEVTLLVKGSKIFCEAVHEDMYTAIRQMMAKLDRKVLSHKDRVQQRRSPAKRLEASLV